MLPFLLGCAFMALISFPDVGELPGGITPALVFMLASVPFWFAAAATRQALVLDRTAATGITVVMICLTFMIVWAFLSALGAEIPLRSGRSIASLAAAFAIFFLIAGTVTCRRLDVFVSILCFTLAFTCLISLIAYFEPHLRSTIFRGTDRASGFFKNSNQFGMAISTLLPVAVAALLGQRGQRPIWFACVIALGLGLVMSGSKMNLMVSTVTPIFVLCSYSTLAYSGGKRVFMIALSAAGSGLVIAANLLLLTILNPRALRLLRDLAAEGEVHSLATRGELWKQSLEQFRLDPIFGEGAGQLLENPFDDGPMTHSHNVLLEYLRTMGAPGFLALAIVLATVLILSVATIRLAFRARWSSLRDRILCIGLASGSLAYLAANFSSDSMGPSTSPFFWAVLFLGLTARLLVQKEGPPAASPS